jgi:hypothetical protein
MFIRIIDGKPEKYTLAQLKKDNPYNTLFPDIMTPENLVDYGAFVFVESDIPQYDNITHKVVEIDPILEGEVYVQTWQVLPLTEQEKSDMIKKLGDEIKEKRRKAYQRYSDPLYFKWKRGDGTEQEYLNKIEAIKAQLPYPQGYDA